MPPILSLILGLLGAFVLLGVIYLAFLVRPAGKMPANRALLCDYAHRGLHGDTIPENSLAAFSLACERGVGIELDVQLSRDGVVMVFHDYTLARMTGAEGRLRERTADELQGLFLLESDQTIPTLAEVLELVAGRVPLLIELKGENLNTALCGRVADLLGDYTGAYCIESFNPWLLRRMAHYLPQAYRGLLYTNLCRDKDRVNLPYLAMTAMVANGLAKPHFIACNHLDRDALPVRLATRLYKAPRLVWTACSEEEIRDAHRRGEWVIFEDK